MNLQDWITVRWDKTTPDSARYYLAYLHQDLWGAWILTRTWGASDSALGRIVHTPVDSRQAGLRALEQLHQLRQRRQYTLTYSTPHWPSAVSH